MILDLFRLDDQVAIVTGARQGIGQAIAIGYAEAGAHIVSIDRSEPVETREAVTALGRRFWWLQADLAAATTPELARLVGRATQEAGRLDILVNNAGTIRRGPALDFSEADWDVVMQTNLKSAFFLSQAAARHFIPQGRGKIVQVASLLSFQGGILVAPYTAAKHALAGITRLMANEWAPLGINVNALAPGYTETTNTAALRADPVRYAALLGRIPAGRWGVPADMAGAALFLASAASQYVNGEVLVVDGGWMAR
jgi:2-dehydro-3-deoxy-D-gluconate 5-dehydrogenase